MLAAPAYPQGAIMTIDNDATPEATLGYFVPEQEFLKLHDIREQLTLLAIVSSPHRNKTDEVMVPLASLAHCFWAVVETMKAVTESAVFQVPE
jgi:hypothetical protein